MRRRRSSPYSQLETMHRSRRELWTLVLLTAGLGVCLNLLASLITLDLAISIPWRVAQYVIVVVISLGLTGLAIARFYATTETSWIPLEIQLPYQLHPHGQAEIARLKAYRVTELARLAFASCYGQHSAALADWQRRWREAQADGVLFQSFIAQDNAALIQCLLVHALHHYGMQSLGPEADYGWSKSQLAGRQLTMDELPSGLRDNQFLRALSNAKEWRLWWPEDVEIELLPNPAANGLFALWRLRHRRYGCVEVRFSPFLSAAGRDSQPFVVLTHGMPDAGRAITHVIGTRLQARTCLRWAFWEGATAFQDWASGLMCALEEALDWGYFLAVRPALITVSLADRIGFVPHSTSIMDELAEIKDKIEQLEARLRAEGSGTRLA